MSPTSEGGGESAPSAAAVVPAGLPPSIGLQGTIATFDPMQDDWCKYVERLQHYFTANDIVSVEKRSTPLKATTCYQGRWTNPTRSELVRGFTTRLA